MRDSSKLHRTVKDIFELGAFFEADVGNTATQVVKEISEAIYNITECGAWFKYDYIHRDVQVGTIVEGSDAEFQKDPIPFPFNTAELYYQLEALELDAEEAWNAANSLEWSTDGTATIAEIGFPEPLIIRTVTLGRKDVAEMIKIVDNSGDLIAYAANEMMAEVIIEAAKQYGE